MQVHTQQACIHSLKEYNTSIMLVFMYTFSMHEMPTFQVFLHTIIEELRTRGVVNPQTTDVSPFETGSKYKLSLVSH